MQVLTVSTIPDDLMPSCDTIYIMPAQNVDETYYAQRTDRNIGWITPKEQQMLRGKTVGLASVGGIGGAVSMMLLRTGIGRLKLADLETFDTSNINRQFGATRGTVDVSKIKAVTRELRAVSDDCDLVLYPMGITEASVDHFLDGCDIVLDGIDYWAVGARVLLQKKARERGIPVMNCSTVGYGSRIFLFTPDGMSMEECLGMTYEQAKQYETMSRNKTISKIDRLKVATALSIGLLPEPPSYTKMTEEAGNIQAIRKLVLEKGTAPGVGASCWLACSFAANQIIFYLLKDTPLKRNVVLAPPAPGYLYLDVGFMRAKVCKGHWLNRQKRKFKVALINWVARRMEAKAAGK